MDNLIGLILLFLWLAPWSIGGYWIVKSAFRLNPAEELFLGLTAGLLFQVVLSSLLGHLLPFEITAWLVSVLIGMGGFILARRAGRLSLPKPQWYCIVFFLLGGIGYGMARGLAIFDDYAHLPTVSTIAAGYFPPLFVYDPKLPYGYHHFLLLFSAQIMRIGSWQPWNSLDAARALTFALAISLAVLWGKRVTGKGSGGLITGLVVAFVSGTRWIFLMFPYGWLEKISQTINLLGSARATGNTLAEAILNLWAIEGGPPINYPFAFANGLLPPGVLMLNGVNGLMYYAILFLFLLTVQRWNNLILASVTSMIALAGTHLISETELPFGLAAIGFVTALLFFKNRKIYLPVRLRYWWGIVLGSALLAVIQGGTWTELFYRNFQRLFLSTTDNTYLQQTLDFEISLIPAIVSGHLGVLPLNQWPTLLAAGIEIGPLLLAIPLVLIWGYKAWRAERWFEAMLVAEVFLSFIMIWVRYSGSLGVRNSSRLFVFLPISLVLAGPIVNFWYRHRSRWVKIVTGVLASMAMLSGVVLLALQISAMSKPVASYFLSGLDVTMYKAYWNKLPPDSLIFDPNPSRSPTIFGRFTDAGETWYRFKPEWEELKTNPDPAKLKAAGFSHAYLDNEYWESLQPDLWQLWDQSCVL
ncbi:MAG: hypothetical protein ACOYXO_12990, partial [Chloroflexota bacterium]